MKPTLEDVAEVAGVSRATVSRVINGSPRVSDGVRATVEGAVKTLGYVPNRAARSLVTQKTESVALVVRETETRLFSEPFFGGITRAISQRLTQSGFQMILVMAAASERVTSIEQYLTGGHVDGVLLLSMHGDDPVVRLLLEAGIPTVVGGRFLGAGPVSSVDADNRGGARAAIDHLVERGHSRIATITGPRDTGAGLDRYEGYVEGLGAADIPIDESLVVEGDFTREGGGDAARALLQRGADFDAVFAASDLMAAGVLQTFAAAGRNVPGDIAVVGFDDSPVAQLTDPTLTTVKQPLDVMGKRMAEFVLEQIDSGRNQDRREVLPTQLVIRGSS